MAAHFTTRPCPVCQATTKHLHPFFGIAAELRQIYNDMAADRHLFVDVSADGEVELLSICQSCFNVFTERKDGSVVQIAATDEQRFAAVTSPITSSEELEADVGDKAPAFEARTDADATWDSAERFGKKWVVVYFYPGDFTPGCTAQAKAFRDAMD